MFKCRMCSEGPFAQLFGIPEEKATATLPRSQGTAPRGTASPVQESRMNWGALFGTPEDKAVNAQQWWTRSAAKPDMAAFGRARRGRSSMTRGRCAPSPAP